MIRPRPSSTLFPDTTLCRSRGNTLAQLGVAYALNGDMNAASRTFAEAEAVNERADNAYAIQIVTWRSARLQVAQGRLRQAADMYRQVLRKASEQAALGQLPVTGYCHLEDRKSVV